MSYYLEDGRWAGLETLELPGARLVNFIIDDNLLRQWLRFAGSHSVHETDRKSFRITECHDIASSGCFLHLFDALAEDFDSGNLGRPVSCRVRSRFLSTLSSLDILL
jgi:hypothetical protein